MPNTRLTPARLFFAAEDAVDSFATRGELQLPRLWRWLAASWRRLAGPNCHVDRAFPHQERRGARALALSGAQVGGAQTRSVSAGRGARAV